MYFYRASTKKMHAFVKWKDKKVSSSLKIRAKLDKAIKVKKKKWKNYLCGFVKQVALSIGVT